MNRSSTGGQRFTTEVATYWAQCRGDEFTRSSSSFNFMALSLNMNRNKNDTFLTKNLLSTYMTPHLRAHPSTPIGDSPLKIFV
jgi:hypothetical protein